jgi:hypothetical protein
MTMENCFSKKIQSLLKKRFLGLTFSDALKIFISSDLKTA